MSNSNVYHLNMAEKQLHSAYVRGNERELADIWLKFQAACRAFKPINDRLEADVAAHRFNPSI